MGETTERAGTGAHYEVIARPRGSLLRSTALSIVFSAVPLAVALVWVSFPLRLWALVGAVVLALVVLAVVVFVRFRTAYVGIGGHRLDLRGVLVRSVSIERARIHRLVLATTFGSSVDRTSRELVALSDNGAELFRMRGTMWDDDALAAVVSGLDVQVTELAKPVAQAEFSRMFPGARPWYERRQVLVAGGIVAVVLVGAVLVAETTGLIAR